MEILRKSSLVRTLSKRLTDTMPQVYAEEVQDKGKKKKWWGDLFKRRARKVSDSSSDEEEEGKKKSFLGRKKKHDRGSKDVTNSFLINPGIKDIRGRSLESVRSSGTQTGKKRIKAKVEASREQLKDSSSDEGSSYTSSLPSGGSFPRRSRAARTERHNRRLWSASVVYQESNDYDLKYRAKTRSATPSPAASPKVRQRAGSHEIPVPPPRKMELPKYHPPVYTAPANPKTKPRYNGLSHHSSDPVIPRDWVDLEVEEKKPPAPPRRLPSLEDKRRQANLEEALNELEAIYKKLEDLQEPQEELGEPLVTDDMAYRRLNKREPSCQDVREIMSQAGSYLLVSPTLSPPPLTPQTPQTPNEPDITFDDVVYRTMNHTNNTLKILDPQPPFGIPLGPISPAANSDYLHATPNHLEYKPPNTPDLVRDDLAFRNLRKDSHELRKKKAVRSYSANLSNVILKNNNNFNAVNNNIEGRSQSYSDIPEEMRLAQRVLDMRRNKRQTRVNNDELRRRFFAEEYGPSETDLLKELEDEARATSLELEEQLAKSKSDALYSRSMADLLKELTKNLDSDFGCTTCEDYNKGSNINYRLDYKPNRPKLVKEQAFSSIDFPLRKLPSLQSVPNKPPSPNFRRFREESLSFDKPRSSYWPHSDIPNSIKANEKPWDGFKGRSESYHGQHRISPNFETSPTSYRRQTPSPKYKDTSPRRSLERLSPRLRLEEAYIPTPKPWTGFNGEKTSPKPWQPTKSLDERYHERLSPRPRWSSLKDRNIQETYIGDDRSWINGTKRSDECFVPNDRLSPKQRWNSFKEKPENKYTEECYPDKPRWNSFKENPDEDLFIPNERISPKPRWSSLKEKKEEPKAYDESFPNERVSPKPRWSSLKEKTEEPKYEDCYPPDERSWSSYKEQEVPAFSVHTKYHEPDKRHPWGHDTDDKKWQELNEICQKMQSDLPSTSSSEARQVERTPTLLSSSPIDVAAMEAESDDEKQEGVSPKSATPVNTTENVQL